MGERRRYVGIFKIPADLAMIVDRRPAIVAVILGNILS